VLTNYVGLHHFERVKEEGAVVVTLQQLKELEISGTFIIKTIVPSAHSYLFN
jgi:hypothetical protein